ncbi:MAG: hypothetical protein AABX70_01040 [Nanoarchaeota archaeon]
MRKGTKSREEVDEVFKALRIQRTAEDEKEVPIIDDGRQVSIRIPAIFLDSLDIDNKKDKFVFKLTTTWSENGRVEKQLEGYLRRG